MIQFIETRLGALLLVALVTLLLACAFAFGLADGAPPTRLFLALGALYAACSVIAVLRIRARDEMHLLKPKAGDVTFGALPAALLYGLVFVIHALVTSPGTPREGWIMRVYMLFGDPSDTSHHFLGVGIALIGAMEELTWRGLLLPALEEHHGTLKASLATSLLWGLAHAPTLWLLSTPVAGPNPLLALGAVGCGLVWAYFRFRIERLPPVIISHALFSWAIVEFALWAPKYGP